MSITRTLKRTIALIASGGLLLTGFAATAAPASASPGISITSITPSVGPMAGGTEVTITGANFWNGLSVSFGGTDAPDVVSVSSHTTIVVNTPASIGGGLVDVVVTNPVAHAGTATSTGGFTYQTIPDPPTGVSATVGDGTADVSWTAPINNGGSDITGYDVSSVPAGCVLWATSSPAHCTGLTNGVSYTFVVVAVNAEGSSTGSDPSTAVVPDQTPVITSLDPSSGYQGNSVTITGTGFDPNATVSIGGIDATVTAQDSTSITFSVPLAFTCGWVGVTVTNPDGGLTDTSGSFTYLDDPSCGWTDPGAGGDPGNGGGGGPTVPQAITFDQPYDMTVGDPSQSLLVSSDSGLPVYVVPSDSSICTVDGSNAVTAVSAGTCILTATQVGDGTYIGAAAVPLSFNISDPSPAPSDSSTPLAAADFAVTVPMDTATTIDVLAHASGGIAPIQMNGWMPPSHGTVIYSEGGLTLQYTPDAGYTGVDSFQYLVHDGTSFVGGTVSINVVLPLTAYDFYPKVNQNTPTTIDVLSYADGGNGVGTYVIDGFGQGAHGAISLSTDGLSLLYTPDNGYAGSDSFTWTAGDGSSFATGTVHISVVIPLTAADFSVDAPQGTPTTIDVGAHVTGGNSPWLDDWNWGVHGMVGSGPSDWSLIYTSDAGYTGSDEFMYWVCDNLGCTTGLISVNVTAAQIPDAPTGVGGTAGNGSASVSWITPSSNGSDITGYTVTAWQLVAGFPTATGLTCTATPPDTSCSVLGLTNGNDYTFTVIATNALGDSAASDPSSSVGPRAPLAAESFPVTVYEGVQASIDAMSHVSGGTGNYTLLDWDTSPHGTITISPNGQSLRYLPDAGFAGTDWITYYVDDGAHRVAAWITVTVSGTVAPSGLSIDMSYGTSLGGSSVTISGSNIGQNATVTFGGVVATSVTFNQGDATITAVTPAGTPGLADVVVTNPGDLSDTLVGAFTYVLIPVMPDVTVATYAELAWWAPSDNGWDWTYGGSASLANVPPGMGVGINYEHMAVTRPQIVLYGKPTTPGTYQVAWTLTDSNGKAMTVNVALTVHDLTIDNLTVSSDNNNPAPGDVVHITYQQDCPMPVSSAPWHIAEAWGPELWREDYITPTMMISSDGLTVTDTETYTLASAGDFTFYSYGQLCGAQTNPATDGWWQSAYLTLHVLNPAPTVDSVDVATGPTLGGTSVTITGSGFQDGAAVTFDGVAATSVVWNSDTSITAVTPAGSAGAVDVVVTNYLGLPGTLVGAFTYYVVPLALPDPGLPKGIAGENYEHVLIPGGASDGWSWSYGGTASLTGLPAGLLVGNYFFGFYGYAPGLDIYGTPTETGTFELTWTVTDADGNTLAVQIPFTVVALSLANFSITSDNNNPKLGDVVNITYAENCPAPLSYVPWGYGVPGGLGGGFDWSYFGDGMTLSSDGLTLTDTVEYTLTNVGDYTFSMYAQLCGASHGPDSGQWWSDPLTLTVAANPPSAPSSIEAVAGNGSAMVTLGAPTNDGGSAVLDYTVTADPGGASCVATAAGSTGVISCMIAGLDNGTAYTFQAYARNGSGNSDLTDPSNEVTPSCAGTLVSFPSGTDSFAMPDPVVAGQMYCIDFSQVGYIQGGRSISILKDWGWADNGGYGVIDLMNNYNPATKQLQWTVLGKPAKGGSTVVNDFVSLEYTWATPMINGKLAFEVLRTDGRWGYGDARPDPTIPTWNNLIATVQAFPSSVGIGVPVTRDMSITCSNPFDADTGISTLAMNVYDNGSNSILLGYVGSVGNTPGDFLSGTWSQNPDLTWTWNGTMTVTFTRASSNTPLQFGMWGGGSCAGGGVSLTPTGLTVLADPPTITSLDVTSGPGAGGSGVYITGTGFLYGDTTATFGGVSASGYVVSDALMWVQSPPGSGTVDVTVTNSDGQSGTLAAAYTYTPVPPVVADDFAANVWLGVPNRIEVIAHSSGGTGWALFVQSVSQGSQGTVTTDYDGLVWYTPGPDATGTDTFTYTVTDGAGDSDTATVTVTIGGPATVSSDMSIVGDGQAADLTWNAPDNLMAAMFINGNLAWNTIVAGMGANFGGGVPWSWFSDTSDQVVTWRIYAIDYAGNGGDPVAFGDPYLSQAEVTFTAADPLTASNFTVYVPQDTATTVDVLPHAAGGFAPYGIDDWGSGEHGWVNISDDGQSLIYTPTDSTYAGPDSFPYWVCDDNGDCTDGTVTVYVVGAPTVTSIDPAAGPLAGGSTVTIIGTEFYPGSTVWFGETPATSVTWISDTSMTAVVPAGAVGPVNVVVSNPDAPVGQHGSTQLRTFTYVAAADAPSKPTGVAGDRQVTVSWHPGASDGGSPVTYYIVTASPGGRQCSTGVMPLLAGVTERSASLSPHTALATSCVVTGLTNGFAYTFTVQSWNDVNWSDQSAASNPITPVAPAPMITTAGVATGAKYASAPKLTCVAKDSAGAVASCAVTTKVVGRTPGWNTFSFRIVAKDKHGHTTVRTGTYRVSQYYIEGVVPDSRGVYHLKYGHAYQVVADTGATKAPRYYWATPAGKGWAAKPFLSGGLLIKATSTSPWKQLIHIRPYGMFGSGVWNIGVRSSDGVLHILHIDAR